MKYKRPKNSIPLKPGEKAEVLKEYFQHYQKLAQSNPGLLNSKLERDAFSDLLDEIGSLLLEKSKILASSPGKVHDFIEINTLPKCLENKLPKDFRVFCLAINSLKQWVSAEQAATDRYLLGGTARNQCKKIATTCIVSGKQLSENEIELHHPARDGRPPIPLTKDAHSKIEGQHTSSNSKDDPISQKLYPIKKQGNRSWVMLRVGCNLMMGNTSNKPKSVQASSKTFARKAVEATHLDFSEILKWLNEKQLGLQK